MELSELVDFGAMLLTMDDRTGLGSAINPIIFLSYFSFEASNCLDALTGHENLLEDYDMIYLL